MNQKLKKKRRGPGSRLLAFALCCSLLCGMIPSVSADEMEQETLAMTELAAETMPETVETEPVTAASQEETVQEVTEAPASSEQETGFPDIEPSTSDNKGSDIKTETDGAESESQAETSAQTEPVQSETESGQQTVEGIVTQDTNDESSETEVTEPEFSSNAELNGVKISIHAGEGILPDGVSATVSPLTEQVSKTAAESVRKWSTEKNLVQLIGYEIKFFDKEGEELHQFDEKIDVTYSGLTFKENAEELRVFHADANSNVTKALTESMPLSNEIKFSSDQFSPILVAVYGRDTAANKKVLSADGVGGVNPLAIGGADSVSIEKDKQYTVTSDTANSPAGKGKGFLGSDCIESWSSSAPEIAEVVGMTNEDNDCKQTTAIITGKSTGTATITHTFYTPQEGFGTTWLRSDTESITVNVTEPVLTYYNVSFKIGEAAAAAGVISPELMRVAEGDTIQTLPAPKWQDENGTVKVFAGWYTDEGFTTEFTTSTSVTADTDLYAKWIDPDEEGMFYVNFYSQDGQTVYLTVAVTEGKTVNPAAGPTMEEMIFRGWSVTRQGETPASEIEAFEFNTPVSDAVEEGEYTLNLYAWYAPMVKVSFASNGGMSVPTQIIAQGEKAENVTPTREGYTFRGWSSSADTYEAFDFNTPIDKDITLYAFWTADMVPVTLVYMYENADDENYSPAGYSETVYAPAGSYVCIEKNDITSIGQSHNVRYSETADGELTGDASKTASGGDNAVVNDVRDTYFQYANATNKRQVMPDGSTVVLVYYNRARITLNFTYNLSSNASIDVNAHISAEDQDKYSVVYTTTTGSYNRFTYSFTAKYGQNIVPVWPQIGWVENDSSGVDTFYTWNCPDNHQQTSNMYTLESSLFMPQNGSGMKIRDGVLIGEGVITSGGHSVQEVWLIYARTTLPGEMIDFVYNNRNYTIYKEACQLGLSSSNAFGYKALDGCSPVQGEPTLSSKYGTYMNIDKVSPQNSTLKNKFDTLFPNQIRNGNRCQVLLYDRTELTLSVWVNDDTYGLNPVTQKYLYGDWIYNEDVDQLKILEAAMTKAGYRFAGWYTDPNFTPGTEYLPDENSRITANMNLYAKWEPSQFLAEYYLYMDDVTPYAQQGFAEGGRIDNKIVPPAVQDSFLGWYWYQNGTLVPFDFTASVGKAHVDENNVLKLYAKWEGEKGKVSYLPGIGGDNSTQEVYDERSFEINEAAVQLPNYKEEWPTGVPADPELTFVGWKAPNGAIYQPGRYVLVTRQLMQFEAQWSKDAVQLIYDGNGGTGETITETWARNSEVSIWDNMDATTPHFTRENYELLGWDENPDAEEPTYELGKGSIKLDKDTTILYAIWKRKTVDLTIKKQVTGTLGDLAKKFHFQWSYSVESNMNANGDFDLGHNDTVELKDVPVGATLTLRETNADGYEISAVYNKHEEIQNAVNGSLVFCINDTDTEIVVANKKDPVPDTGIILDSLPYVLILVIVVVGGVLFLRRRRNRYEN